MKKKGFSLPTVIMLLILVMVATFVVAYYSAAEQYANRLGNVTALEEKYAKLNEVSALVERYFVGEYNEEDVIDSMLSGYVNGLGDKWSGYYDKEQTALINESNSNQYVGIGVTIDVSEAGEFVISGVNKDGSAFEAGIKIGDVITHVNGESADNFETTTDLANKVRGDEGTKVRITVRRGDESLESELVRKAIFNETVETEMIGNIGHVYISGFETNTEAEFKEKVNALVKDGAKGLIFDVRFNGGGYVYVMADMLDMLLPEGMIISMFDKKGNTREYTSDASRIELPMAVLTNEYSISAAEFFAAALQEYGVAMVIGDKTGGKGYAQNMFTLSDGSSVNISSYSYYTPKGKSLAETGITPDIEISLSEEDFYNFYYLTNEQDTQLQKALEYVNGQITQ